MFPARTDAHGRDTTPWRLIGLISSLLDPRAWIGLLRLLHYHNYSSVRPRRHVTVGPSARLAPNLSFVEPERVEIGARSRIGARSHLWGGRTSGRIRIGEDCLFGPEVFITASNYATDPDTPVWRQPSRDADVVIGDDVWLGARVVVLPGAEIGSGAVVGAASVVTRSLPAGCIAAGSPARVVGWRDGTTVDAGARDDAGRYGPPPAAAQSAEP